MTRITRGNLARGGALGAGALAASIVAAPAAAQSDKLRWRIVISWPKRLPGPGMSAEPRSTGSKEPAAAFFTTVPFGLLPNEHVAWIDAGGGQALWDELYAPFGVKPFMAGNIGSA